MKPDALDLQDLRLGSREIEALSGLEVSDRSIGGAIGGVYRFSQLRHLGDWIGWLLLEGVAMALLFVLTLPIGLAILRWSSGSTTAMLTGMGGATLIAALGRTAYRIRRSRTLQTFIHLLDEIDRYREVLEAVVVLEQLQSIRASNPLPPSDRFDTLQITRDCLVAGLKTERILREFGRRSQTEAGLAQLEHSLYTLEALSLQDQADDYSTLLSQALQIAQAVRTELVKSYGSEPPQGS
jgi:hypothetical protein